MKKTAVMRLIFTLTICLAMVGVVMAAYILKKQWHVANLGFASLGVYGVLLLAFLVVQQILSLLNNNYWIPKLTAKSKNTPGVGIQAVGYREDPALFRGCLLSLAKQDYAGLERIVVGIDGNEEKDQLMEQAFITVFPQGLTIRLDKMYQDMSKEDKQNVQKIIAGNKYVCVSQPHAGKREIMYTAMHMHTENTQFICFTDSDTFFETNTVSEMVKVIDGYDELCKENPKRRKCGAVTGNVLIWNQQNIISYLSSLRYWFAFNVERAADSFFGVVSCISGPLGLYRKEVINQIKEQWINQTFMGTKCSFGDDRHLTNLLLINGYCTFYTPHSDCKTDTPAELLRWIAQQTRWCKSFYREFLINIKAFHKQPLWLAVQLVFQTVLPFFILVTFIWFVTLSLDVYCIVIIMIILMGFIRGLIGVIRNCEEVYFYYAFYVILYALFLVPSKMFAMMTLWNNEWGTSSRLGRTSPICKAIHALIWAVFFIAFYIGIGVKHLVNGQKLTEPATKYMFFVCVGFMVFLAIHWQFYSRMTLLPRCKKEFEENLKETEMQINQRRAEISQIGKFVTYKTISTTDDLAGKSQNMESIRELTSATGL